MAPLGEVVAEVAPSCQYFKDFPLVIILLELSQEFPTSANPSTTSQGGANYQGSPMHGFRKGFPEELVSRSKQGKVRLERRFYTLVFLPGMPSHSPVGPDWIFSLLWVAQVPCAIQGGVKRRIPIGAMTGMTTQCQTLDVNTARLFGSGRVVSGWGRVGAAPTSLLKTRSLQFSSCGASNKCRWHLAQAPKPLLSCSFS